MNTGSEKPSDPSPDDYTDAYTRRPTLARRGLMPGRRVFVSTAWTAALVGVVVLSVWAATSLSGGGPDQPVAAQVDPAPARETPLPTPSEEAQDEVEPEPEEEPEPEVTTQEETVQEEVQQPEPDSVPQEEERSAEEAEEPSFTGGDGGSMPIIDGHEYRLVSAGNLNMCVDVKEGSARRDANIRLWGCNGGLAQNFIMHWDGQGLEYVLEFRENCVNVAGTSQEVGADIRTWDCNGTGAQTWRLEAQPGLSAYSLVATHSNQCMDVDASDFTQGTNIRQWVCNGSDAQVFHVEPAP
ncbi:RICIN domain-containing protein [Streptomyces mayteni]